MEWGRADLLLLLESRRRSDREFDILIGKSVPAFKSWYRFENGGERGGWLSGVRCVLLEVLIEAVLLLGENKLRGRQNVMGVQMGIVGSAYL